MNVHLSLIPILAMSSVVSAPYRMYASLMEGLFIFPLTKRKELMDELVADVWGFLSYDG